MMIALMNIMMIVTTIDDSDDVTTVMIQNDNIN